MKTFRIFVLIFFAVRSLAVLEAQAGTPLKPDAAGEQWAQQTLASMSTEEKIGQLIMVWAKVRFLNTGGPEYADMIEAMRTYHVGGFGVTVPVVDGQLALGQPLEAAAITNRLQRESKLPLLMAADFERGLSMRLTGPTAFPAAMAFGAAGDVKLAREFGRISALESRAIGIHWNWFPVADVNSNPKNPIIDTRSFSEDPAQVGAMVAAYIEGAHQAGMLTTLKHFPGHGDTSTDSHQSLSRVDGALDRLNKIELVPFRAGIAAGADSVMIGHLIVPALEPDQNKPASISSRVIDGLLKKQMGFDGLVVTDAIDMNGLKMLFHGSEAEISAAESVAAIEAGNDMIIIPGDLGGAYNGLLYAVKSGRISSARIDQSVLKVLRMKATMGLERNRLVDLAEVDALVGRPENQALARSVAERAITLVLDKNNQLPLKATGPMLAVVFTDHGRPSDAARALAAELRKRAPGSPVYFVDSASATWQRNEILQAAHAAAHIIAVAEAMPSPRAGQGQTTSASELDSASLDLLSTLVKENAGKTVVAALGNPYTGGELPAMQAYVCTFSDTPLSASALIGALFGETPIHGHLPVTIPGLAQRGTGLDRASILAATPSTPVAQ